MSIYICTLQDGSARQDISQGSGREVRQTRVERLRGEKDGEGKGKRKRRERRERRGGRMRAKRERRRSKNKRWID